MGYVEQTLHADEEIVLKARMSRVPLAFSFLWTWIMLFIPSFIGWLRVRSWEYAVTSRRVIGKTGVISRQTFEIPLETVVNVEYSQGLLARLFNYGSVHVSSTSGRGIFSGNLRDPVRVRNVISERSAMARDAKQQEQTRVLAEAMTAAQNAAAKA